MPLPLEVMPVSKTFQDWFREGEELYQSALKDYQDLEKQLEDLEKRLEAKQAEVNQIAQMLGKPPVEPSKRLSAQIVEGEHSGSGSSPAAIARALTGRTIHR
jgi:hypothetical protein